MPVMTTPGWPLPFMALPIIRGRWTLPAVPRARALRRGRGGGCCFLPLALYFLFSYTVTFGEITAGDRAAPRGRRRRRRAVQRLCPASQRLCARARARLGRADRSRHALERSVYVWIASLMLIAVCALWQPIPGVGWQVPTACGLAAAAAAAGGRLADAAQRRHHRHLGAGRGRGTRSVEGRPSRSARHWSSRPTARMAGCGTRSISAGCCWCLPVATMTMTRLVFAVVSSVYILVGDSVRGAVAPPRVWRALRRLHAAGALEADARVLLDTSRERLERFERRTVFGSAF